MVGFLGNLSIPFGPQQEHPAFLEAFLARKEQHRVSIGWIAELPKDLRQLETALHSARL